MGNEQSSEQFPEDREAEERRDKEVSAAKNAELDRKRGEVYKAYMESLADEIDFEQRALSEEQTITSREPPAKLTTSSLQPEPHSIPVRSIGSSQPTPEPSSDSILQAFQPRKEPRQRSDAVRPSDASSAAVKRPAPTTSAYTDERRTSIGRLPKIAKKSLGASPQSPKQSEDSEDRHLAAVRVERPPKWYTSIRLNTTRVKNSSNVETLLRALRTQITKCQTACRNGEVPQNALELIRDKLHKIVFIEVTGELLKQNRMLHDEDGLPQLFDDKFTKGVKWPYDIKADARELYNKWSRRVFETDMFRGILFKVKAAKDKKDGTNNTESIDPEYRGVVSARYHGNGDLLNGQWWPTLLCAYRDGAHGMTIAGICGNSGEGAYSVFMSSGHDYDDEDWGEEVLYCGTDSDNGSITENTRYMLESVNNRPVRLLRSAKLDSPYAPKLGFRYDGLYDVVSYKNLDGSNSLRQRHHFRLVRQPGQDPIRGGNGPDRRPTEQEIEDYKKHRFYAGKNKSTF